MRKSNKEQLFKAAFKEFLIKQYDGVSISDIEESSGFTRGAIFYYAKNKLDLFRQVVNYYIIDKQDINNKIQISDILTFKEFILQYVEGVKRAMNSMKDLIDDLSPTNASRAYMSMILQVNSFFPDLHEKYIVNCNNELSIWISMLQHGIMNKEIRSDIDTLNTARHFMSIFYGESYLDALGNGLKVDILKDQMLNIYKLIKVDR